MRDLTDARWIKFKGVLFALVGLFASVLLLLEVPTLKVAVLLSIAIWCFCRAYYFAFYVIEKYVYPGYRFYSPDLIAFSADGAYVAAGTNDGDLALITVADGKLNKQIAAELDIQETTIKQHVSAILRKLGLINRTQAGVLLRSLHFQLLTC